MVPVLRALLDLLEHLGLLEAQGQLVLPDSLGIPDSQESKVQVVLLVRAVLSAILERLGVLVLPVPLVGQEPADLRELLVLLDLLDCQVPPAAAVPLDSRVLVGRLEPQVLRAQLVRQARMGRVDRVEQVETLEQLVPWEVLAYLDQQVSMQFDIYIGSW